MAQRIFKSLLLISLVLTAAACSQTDKNNKQTKISQIEYINHNDYYYDPVDGRPVNSDRIELTEKINCGYYNRLFISAKSLGLNEKAYIELMKKLTSGKTRGEYFKFTFSQCSNNEGTVSHVQPCTSWSCGKEFVIDTSVTWLMHLQSSGLGNKLIETRKQDAAYFLTSPIEKDKQHDAWKVSANFAKDPDKIAIEAYLSSNDLKNAHFVSDFRAYYGSGNLRTTLTFDRQGNIQGKVVSYYDEQGKTLSVQSFKDNKLDGESVFYHSNGTLASKELYLADIIVTPNGIAYYDNGQVEKTYNYNSSGKQHGTLTKYYQNGKISYKANYINGAIVGKKTSYYSNGKIKEVYNHNQKGGLEGQQLVYSSNGRLISKVVYSNGIKRSSQTWYDNGNKKAISYWDTSGYGTGENKRWYENGKLSRRENLKKGQYVGVLEEYDRQGRITYKKYYR